MYDVVIIGAGPGGMTAALYAARSNLSVLMLEKGLPGGQMNNTAEIENYPGFESILGPDLSMKMLAGTEKFGVELKHDTVEKIENGGSIKIINGLNEMYQARTIIIATGAVHKMLGVKGEDSYSGMGVSYCAVCDGAFFRNKELLVVGGGDSAVEEAIYLTQFASKVTIVHRRDTLRAQKILQERAFNNEKISFEWNAVIEEIKGNQMKVTSVQLKNPKNDQSKEITADGVFIYVGLDPITQPFTSLEIVNDNGWIRTDERMRTTIPGIYAIGDVREKVLRQVTTAVGDGSIAGQEAYKYIEENSKINV
ncbi:thioredoxin-disulfide reductase [Enterococcus sp. FR202]|uniref:thioredoxin-disulfide reductase n=1 Tax=unclassified Enterococcus TaxID=2608891 RepID=UPI00280FAAAC|nr:MULTISPECIES: thioredoxin-disulfide reductase [unclassified Enterococcus]MDQ8604504.1 thioredoxin-disulfide reductase [Enterococcus sp. FR202]MDQ8627535.1 thioredoxin-disulfide reductase [Enterococcus sp. FR204]MDQ8659020.1 thioredoxin-disulfide reductase [Enterococcus sp. FR205]MDQ8666835.1 thioredoxin-disulfide reductase [Enterococcus sp. FR203]MDQ8669329.1 thioredoxin-disulfide reductase [Enterococcus sp. FR206]